MINDEAGRIENVRYIYTNTCKERIRANVVCNIDGICTRVPRRVAMGWGWMFVPLQYISLYMCNHHSVSVSEFVGTAGANALTVCHMHVLHTALSRSLSRAMGLSHSGLRDICPKLSPKLLPLPNPMYLLPIYIHAI